MSAYIVDRETIQFLVGASMSRQVIGRHSSGLSWWHDSGRRELKITDKEYATKVGQMLWDENAKSVMHRYPNDTLDSAPGPIGETYQFRYRYTQFVTGFEPIQVLSTIMCYEYQSCEHPDWEKSEACAFIRSLQKACIHQITDKEEISYSRPRTCDEVRATLRLHPSST